MLGTRVPRLRSVPDYVATTGPEVAELCKLFGLILDPWQCDVIADSLGEGPDGLWAASQIALIVARQNGKSEVLIARMLAGLFLLDEEEIIYSAHRADTSMKIFQRFVKYLKRNKSVAQQIRSKKIRVNNSHGQEGVTLASGQTVGFRTRAQEGGRGFSADCIFFDEAFELAEELQAAILPTLIARPNPQVWYVGTPVDQQVHRNGVVFSRIREKGLRGDPTIAFLEWSVDRDIDKLDPVALDDRSNWAEANPSLGYQANEETIALARGSLKARKFATECLCIGDWPSTDESAYRVIDPTAWGEAEDTGSRVTGSQVYAIEVSQDRESAVIASGGLRPDGLTHLRIVEAHGGVGWVIDWCQEMAKKQRRTRFVVDPRSPAGALLPDLAAAKVKVHELTTEQFVQATGGFLDAVRERNVKQVPHPRLEAAVESAAVRSLGGAWAWDRKSVTDISALVAATVAWWGAQNLKQVAPGVLNLNQVAEKAVKEGRAEGRCPRCLMKYDEGDERTHFCPGRRL